jgi:hypothetical protein
MALLSGVSLVSYFAHIKTQTIRLANGTELSFVTMSHGPTNLCFPGSILDKLIYRFGPAKGIRIGRFNIGPVTPMEDSSHYMEDGRVAFPNKAVVWIRHRGGTNAPPLPVPEDKSFLDIRATIMDETGEEWEMRPNSMRLRSLSQNPLNAISSWGFSAYPRRGRVLKFRIDGRNSSDQWERLAEFKMPNPTTGFYPLWKPMDMPVTRTNGNVEVSLVDLISGTKTIHGMPKDRRPFTMVRFKVKQNGQPTEAWLPDRMEATDATGNEADFPIIDYGATNGFIFYDAQGTSLSPSEVWRLRMRFTHEKDLAPDQIWSSPALAVHDGILLPVNLTTNFQSCALTLECSPPNTIRLKLNPKPKNARLRLVGIVDNRGTKVEYMSGYFNDDQFDAQWKIAKEAESITITIGLTEMRHFDFLAQPVRQ